MNLPALKGGVSCKRCIVYEVRSERKLLSVGSSTIFLLVLPILTALKLARESVQRVLDPTANKLNVAGILVEFGLPNEPPRSKLRGILSVALVRAEARSIGSL
jgi:hypothetical protein